MIRTRVTTKIKKETKKQILIWPQYYCESQVDGIQGIHDGRKINRDPTLDGTLYMHADDCPKDVLILECIWILNLAS